MNLAGILEQAAANFPDSVAILEHGTEITYTDLEAEVSLVAAGLAGLGLRPGELVGICLPNSREWLALYFGIIRAGGVAVTLFHGLPRDELLQILGDCRPRFLFTHDRAGRVLTGIDPPGLERIIYPGGDFTIRDLTAAAGKGVPAHEADRDDVAAILYTGGTMGWPKGVMLTHENLITSAYNVAFQERSTNRDRALCFLPLNHVFGQVHITLSTILTAGSLVLLPAFDLEAVLACFREKGVTKFYSVPTVYVRLLQMEDVKDKLFSVRYCFSAAASMAAEVVAQWRKRTGLKIFEAYGLTESASMVTYNHYHHHVAGSVGAAVGTVEVSIRDENGGLLDRETPGEICIRGRNIMKGYLNRPLETAGAFWGDWFRSGDVGYLDRRGYLYIVDRLKDLIITGGENVSPREIEEYLYQREEVEECAVIGLPDKEYGERVTAFIVPKKGRDIDPDSLKAFLKTRLSGFKVPKGFIQVTGLPKSPAGKILKRELKKSLPEK